MELRLADIISNLLVFGFKIFLTDIDDFFSRVHFFLHEFPKFWNNLCEKMQKSSNTSSSPLHCYREICGDDEIEKRKIPIAEINSMLSRVGMVGLDDCENKSNLGEGDLAGLFDDEEPSFDEVKETFKVFDANDDGFADAADLQRVIGSLGFMEDCCSLDECKRMIKRFDVNGDGFIDFQEFLIFMEKCLC